MCRNSPVGLQMILSGAAPRSISWVTSQINFGSCGLQLEWGRVVYVLNKTDRAQQSNVCKPSFGLDYFHFNVVQSGGSDSHCIGSWDSDILDILLYRITFTKIGHTTLGIIFIVNHIYDMIISWLCLLKNILEKIQPPTLGTKLYVKLCMHNESMQWDINPQPLHHSAPLLLCILFIL